MSKADIDVIKNELSHQRAHLKLILEETRRTNGRIKKLEQWRSFTAGAVAALGYALSYVINS